LLGVALGIGLAGLAVWGDFEAMSYFYTGAGYAGFSGLKCPALMTRDETVTISATLDNPGNQPIEPYYQVDISGIAGLRHLENQVTVPPHSSKTVQWAVGAEDIDLGSFVMVKMDILPMAGYSTREATCGMAVLNLGGLSGGQAVGWSLGLSLLATVLGLVIREAGPVPIGGKELSLRNAMRATGILTCAALFAALSGWWLFGFLFGALTLLLLVIMLRMAVS
jgi:hypothetical protein